MRSDTHNPNLSLDHLPIYGTAQDVAWAITATRFPIRATSLSTHWRKQGLEFVRLQGRAMAKFSDAFAMADAKIAAAAPSDKMRGGLSSAQVASGEKKAPAAPAPKPRKKLGIAAAPKGAGA